MEAMQAQFQRDGFCVARNLLSPDELLPLRWLIERTVAERAQKFVGAGTISNPHKELAFDRRWAAVTREALSGPHGDGEGGMLPGHELGAWGGDATLQRCVYQLYTHPSVVELVDAALDGAEELTAHGDYWIRPMSQHQPAGHYPFHQDSFYCTLVTPLP